uniref:Uncharacterized protein n=1 Tax=Arundo donax TaxID=35708 RepID=A0A0A8Z792_ARUDO
MRRGSGGVC